MLFSGKLNKISSQIGLYLELIFVYGESHLTGLYPHFFYSIIYWIDYRYSHIYTLCSENAKITVEICKFYKRQKVVNTYTKKKKKTMGWRADYI